MLPGAPRTGRRLILDRDVDFGEGQLAARLARTLDMPEADVLRLLYERGFRAAGEPATAAIAQTIREVLRPEFAALAAEVNKTLIYTASKTRGQSVERIYLLGTCSSSAHTVPNGIWARREEAVVICMYYNNVLTL